MILRVAFIVISTAIVLSVGTAYALIEMGKKSFYAPGPLAAAVFFEIPRGAGAARVASDLAAAGVIDAVAPIPANLLFREGVRRTGNGQSIRFGTFEIPAAASMADILEIITDPEAVKPRYRVQLRATGDGGEVILSERHPGVGSYAEIATFKAGEAPVPRIYTETIDAETSIGYWVAVPEGLTSWQISESLKLADFLTGEVGEVPLEGALAPDTYSVMRGLERATLIDRMKSAQDKILEAEWAQKSDDVPVETPEQALILASIIEKETSLPSERGLVASVFVNRLRVGMPLQTDPSVIYGVTEGKTPLKRGLRKSELERDTPFNTYLYKGLPPSPIANPGRMAIRAALNPDTSEYYYFVADGTGGHAFAANYDEHRRNVRAWREVERANSAGN